MKIWQIILIVNAISALIFYFIMRGKAELRTYGKPKDGEVMNYFIAGNVGQGNSNFGLFLQGYKNYHVEGGTTCVIFKPHGFWAKTVAKQIEDDALEHNYKVRIWAISLGDEVARELEARGNLTRLETVDINPCVDIDTVASPFSHLVRILAVPMGIIKVALGWLSYLPVIPVDGGNYSYATLTDQYLGILFYKVPESANNYQCSKLVVYSRDDQFLRNTGVARYFYEVKSVTADIDHGNTVLGKQAYLDAMVPELARLGWFVEY